MDKTEIVLRLVFKPLAFAPELLQPREQTLHLPPASVPAQRPPILSLRFASIDLMWRDHLDAFLSQLRVKRVAVIGPVSDQSLRSVSGKTLSESFSDKGDFMRRSRRRVYGDRKTRAGSHRQELPTFAPLGLSHVPSPFFATMKVASIKQSLRSRSPRVRRSSANASSTRRSVPSLTHCWNLRWQVWYGGNLSGRSCHLAPLGRMQSTPLSTSRVSRQGRPLPSSRRGGSGISGAISAPCSSVNSSLLAMPKNLAWHL